MILTMVCFGLRWGGGIQTVVFELLAELSNSSSVARIYVITNGWPAHVPVPTKVRVVPVAPWLSVLDPLPHYWRALLGLPLFSIIATWRLNGRRQQWGVIFNQGGTQTLLQDVMVFHSCHTAWVAKKRRSGRLTGWVSPLDWFVCVMERLNRRSGHYKVALAVSDVTRGEVCRYLGFPEQDVQVVPNGVNLARFNVKAKEQLRGPERSTLGLGDADVAVLFVGNEWKRKGLERLANAVGRLWAEGLPVWLLVAGRDLGSICDHLQVSSGLGHRLRYLGAVQQIERVYAAGDLFCLPSDEDAFGLVIGEALAMGLPVVTTDACGIVAHCLTNDENAIILKAPADAEDLTVALRDLVISQQTRLRLARSGSAVAERKLGWASVANMYLHIAHQISARP